MRVDLSQDLRRRPRVFLPFPDTVRIAAEELHHLKVRRADAQVLALNGQGAMQLGTVGRDGLFVAEMEVTPPALPNRSLIAALPARSALRNLVGYAVMGSCRHLILFSSDHSHSHGNRYSEKDHGKVMDWVREAMKQSLNPWETVVEWSSSKNVFTSIRSNPGGFVVYDPSGDNGITLPACPLIGPEGGWSEREMLCFRDYGVAVHSLPMAILTAPAAALVALSRQECGADR